MLEFMAIWNLMLPTTTITPSGVMDLYLHAFFIYSAQVCEITTCSSVELTVCQGTLRKASVLVG